MQTSQRRAGVESGCRFTVGWLAFALTLVALLLAVVVGWQAVRASRLRAELDTAHLETVVAQGRGDAYQTVLREAYAAQGKSPPKPEPVVTQHGFHTEAQGFGGLKMLVGAEVQNNGAPGVVRVTGIALWSTGTKSRDVDVFIATGQKRKVDIEIPDIGKGAGHQVDVKPAE